MGRLVFFEGVFGFVAVPKGKGQTGLAVADIGIRLLRKEEEIDETVYKIKLIESKK